MSEFDCKDIQALLSGIVDGELDETSRHQAERHLAGCAACRALVNEAETINALIAMEGRQNFTGASLPAGFENAVLRQTVFADAYQFAGRKWTSWLGWVAAAACLVLAVSLWFLNPRTSGPGVVAQGSTSQDGGVTVRPTIYHTSGRSWTYDGGLSPDVLQQMMNAGDSSAARTVSLARPTTPQVSSINHDDSDALYAASNLLSMLESAEHDSFAVADSVRQIAEYDDLLDRLADVKPRLEPADRVAVMAAEGVLLRIVNGPVNRDDLRSMSRSIAAMNLPEQIESISARWFAASSL